MPPLHLPRPSRWLLLWFHLWLVIASGCIPAHAAFLRIPVRVGSEHPGGLAIVRLSIHQLQERMAEFDPTRAAFFFRGREPLPHEYTDADQDGTMDTVVLKLPVRSTNLWVVMVCPGPRVDERLPPGGSDIGVTVELAKSRNRP